MEKILDSAVYKKNTINTKSRIVLAYAFDIDIVGRTAHKVTTAFLNIERESVKMRDVVIDSKTEIMLATAKDSIDRNDQYSRGKTRK